MIQVVADKEELSRTAAELFTHRAIRAAAEQGRFSVALSGGTTPRRTYELLSRSPWRDRVPWDRVHVFWGDERCVPRDDPRSNRHMARDAVLDHVPLPEGQIHPMDCADDPAEAASRYEAALRKFFAPGAAHFDLVFLGLGEDGHTASLFPGDAALRERERWVARVKKNDEDFARLTLTLPVINAAATVIFLVSGKEKATILSEVLKGPTGRFPVQLIAPGDGGEVRWLVDYGAAGKT